MREYSERERYLLWLNFAVGENTKAYYELLERFEDDATALFRASEKRVELSKNVDEALADKVKKCANERFIDKCFERLKSLNISVTTFDSDDYPSLLKEIYDPPSALYFRGKLMGEITLPIAVVGTRRSTQTGDQLAAEIAREMANVGATIVSGMALGIDGSAAKGALMAKENEYPTIAVLGSGVDVIYPEENADLYNRIVERGAVVSEYFPRTGPTSDHFPARNRIISGMAQGTLVVEMPKRSGAHITADFALDYGRDLFAMPGRANDPKCQGTNKLLRDGVAKLVLSAADVLEEYGIVLEQEEKDEKTKTVKPHKDEKKAEPIEKREYAITKENLDEKQRAVYDVLTNGEKSFDDLCELTGFSAAMLNSVLTTMSFSEIIKQSPGRIYGLMQ